MLIGLTRIRPDGTRLEQMSGTVAAAAARGITVALGGTRAGETFRLPPDLRTFHPAATGEYRLRGTGEVVANPAFTATFDIHAPT